MHREMDEAEAIRPKGESGEEKPRIAFFPPRPYTESRNTARARRARGKRKRGIVMEYRSYRDTDCRPSLLGLGCMRLPTLEPGGTAIDCARAGALVDEAVRGGITYFDVAYPYHGGGAEKFIGAALEKYPRESFYLATKMPLWKLETQEDMEQVFNEQLANCRVDYFDFYLCHAVDAERFEKIRRIGAFEFLARKKAEGKIRRLGFSFHDKPAVLRAICAAYPWDFAQLQLNYLDWTVQRAREQYEILQEYGLPCIVMEPVRGGALASLCPEAEAVLKAKAPGRSIASWAIRFAASLPGVLVVLSGMSSEEQLADNLAAMSPFQPLTKSEQNALTRAVRIDKRAQRIPCTGCRYCMPCPFGVDIPGLFKAYNRCAAAKSTGRFLKESGDIPAAARPAACRACGKCARVCPQHIGIPEEMAKLRALEEKLREK